MLTAGANWAAEPIRGGRRETALMSDEAHKDGRPAETQFDLQNDGEQKEPMKCFRSVRFLFCFPTFTHSAFRLI